MKRQPEFHEISRDDLKWLWAAYKKGSLGGLSDHISQDAGPDQFNEQVAAFLDSGLLIWVMSADNEKGRVPVGVVFGYPITRDAVLMGEFTWFPWATDRNIYESTVNIINTLRDETNLVLHAEPKNKDFANVVARHGIIRRVGTMYEIKDEPLALFQSRRSKWATF